MVVAEEIVAVAVGCTMTAVFVAAGEAAGVGVEPLHDELDNDMEIINALMSRATAAKSLSSANRMFMVGASIV